MMECYQTCVDRGKKCMLQREKFSCNECGKVKPFYNIPVDDSKLCPPPESCDHPPKEEKEKPLPRPREFCNCKQSCWNWILSFIGVGGDLPECCKNVPLTPWESGSSARQVLVTKVHSVVSRVSLLGTSPHTSSLPKTDPKIDSKESVKKTVGPISSAEIESHVEGVNQVSSEQVSGKDSEVTPATEKKGKSAKSHSTTSNRGRSRKRKSTISKSRSSSRDKHDKKSSSKTRSASSSSSGASVGDKRSKSRSRSRSSIKVFNPFKRKPSFCACPSSSNVRSGVCPPLPCLPQSQSRSYLTRVNEEQSSGLSQKCSFTSAYKSQIPSIAARPLRRSLSMSCRPSEKYVKPAMAGNCQKAQGTGSTKSAGRSQSFHTTLLNSPSLRPVVIPSFNPLCSSCSPAKPQKSICSCTTEGFSDKPKNSPKPSCIPTKTPHNSSQSYCRVCGKQKSAAPAMAGRSTCSCRSPSKSPSRGCTQTSTKPCCQSSSNKPDTAPCSPRVNQRQPKCILSTSKENQCPCPPSGPCTCANKKAPPVGSRPAARMPPTYVDPLAKFAFSTATTMNYVKARQNDAICQQLLAKYGYSPPPRRLCPDSCFETYREGLCPYSSCMSSSPRCSGIGGCKACRPNAGEHGSGASRPSENYTNSRKPHSPERGQIKQQEIHFNSSPCERQSISEFHLPPHCIRDTGPRSPVDEYLAILRLPKPVRRSLPEPVTADANQEKPTESADRSNDEKEKKKPAGKVAKKQKKKPGKEESKNEDENASANNDNSSVASTASCCTGEMCYKEPEDIPIIVSDYNPPEDEVCCNNNYGGQSFCYSPFSSAGPVQIDFGELNTYNGSYSGLRSQNSASSIKSVPYSTPTYRLSSSSFDVHATSSLSSQMSHSYSMNSGDLSGNVMFGNRGYSDRSVNFNINAQKAHVEKHPLSIATSSNGFGMDVPGNKAYAGSRFHENLEREIQNKIKELREMGIFDSPSRRSYGTTLSTPAASTTRALHALARSDPLKQGFIRDRLNQKCVPRHWETAYASKYGRFPEATSTADTAKEINTAEVLPKPGPSPRDKRFNKKEIVTDHHEQKQTISRKVNETIKQKDEPQANAPNPSRKIEEQKQLEAAQVKLEKEKPSPRRECVFQSFFEKLEETVQIFVRQKKCDEDGSGYIHKPKESEQQLTMDVRGNKEIIVDDETVSSHWIEQNQSSNKLDKNTANVRPLLAKNSPPHKPVLSKSSDLKNSGSICSCSCHTNSPGTSSVSLEITGSVQSSEDVSESCSILDTSPSYTKLVRLDRIGHENFCTPVNKSCATATRPAQLTKTADSEEIIKGSHKIINERWNQTCSDDNPKSCLPPRVYHTCDDPGSSVDPVDTDAGDSNTGHKTEDDCELEDARCNKNYFEPYESGKNTKQHVICYQDSPPDDEPMSELMREFIRHNGTPV